MSGNQPLQGLRLQLSKIVPHTAHTMLSAAIMLSKSNEFPIPGTCGSGSAQVEKSKPLCLKLVVQSQPVPTGAYSWSVVQELP